MDTPIPNKHSDFYDRLQMTVEVLNGTANEVHDVIVNLEDVDEIPLDVYLTTIADFIYLDLRFRIEEVQKNLDFFAEEKKRLTGIDELLRNEMFKTMSDHDMSALQCNYGIKLALVESSEALVPKREPTNADIKKWASYVKAKLSWNISGFKKAIAEGILERKDVEEIGFEFSKEKHLRISQHTETPEFGD